MKRILLSFTIFGALMFSMSPAMGQKVVRVTDLNNKKINTGVVNEETRSTSQALEIKGNEKKQAITGQNESNPMQQGNATIVRTSSVNPPANNPVPLTCTWDQTTYDFGKEVEHRKPVTATYTLTNNGEVPVTISAVYASCGCTAPSYTKEPIKPGETGTVSLTFDAKVSGVFSKSANVRLNDGQRYSLIIKGEVQKVL
ncbi:MAG: DUF1573 domain-containing protein [Bacteroidales bacterium]|nr:DUF1573 domain-containing protein [Bacteroidales bacterium]